MRYTAQHRAFLYSVTGIKNVPLNGWLNGRLNRLTGKIHTIWICYKKFIDLIKIKIWILNYRLYLIINYVVADFISLRLFFFLLHSLFSSHSTHTIFGCGGQSETKFIAHYFNIDWSCGTTASHWNHSPKHKLNGKTDEDHFDDIAHR